MDDRYGAWQAVKLVAPLAEVKDRGIRLSMDLGSHTTKDKVTLDEKGIIGLWAHCMRATEPELHPTDLTVTVTQNQDGTTSSFTIGHYEQANPEDFDLDAGLRDRETAGRVIEALLAGSYRLTGLLDGDLIGHLEADGLVGLACQGDWSGYNTYHMLKVWPWPDDNPLPLDRPAKHDFTITIQCTVDGQVVDDSHQDTATAIASIHEVYDDKIPERMSAAEFMALREELHLPVAWLADRWQVRRQTVLRWQTGMRAIPDQIVDDLHLLDLDTDKAVQELRARDTDKESRARDVRVIKVPKGDGNAEDGMPKAWHRMVGRRAASASPWARIAFQDEGDIL